MSLSHFNRSGATWSALTAYLGKIHPSHVSDPVNDEDIDRFVSSTAATKASHTLSVLFMCKHHV